MTQTLSETAVFLLDLETENGDSYQGRVTGSLIYENDNGDYKVFLTDYARLLSYDEQRVGPPDEIDDPEQIREYYGQDAYVAVMRAIGEQPIIDL